MVASHVYLTHPQVRIDPRLSIPQWSLSAEGRWRMVALCEAEWITRFRRIVSSEEVKSQETANLLGARLSLRVEVHLGLHENDRSATGYLPRDEFEATADTFFGHPDASVRGWETARDAQARIVAALGEAIGSAPDQPTLVVGHGAVGTLFKCALVSREISRREDQSDGGGCHFGFMLEPKALTYDWRPLEDAPPS